MIFGTDYKQWADVHVFCNLHNHRPIIKSKNAAEEYKWRRRQLNSPNGDLLVKNSFFDSLCVSSKIHLAHITYNLKEIISGGYIYSSGGCLVGSVYCFPLFESDNGFRMHNLGAYIYDKEAPLASKNNKKKPDIILFEIETPSASKNLIGIDYLRFGNNHFNIYKSLEYLLSSRERNDLQSTILRRIKNSIDYLSLSGHYYHADFQDIDYQKFLDLYIKTIDMLPILGYFYFEVISEYLMLFQDGNEATKCHKFGEFYNSSYKDLMFGLFPSLAGDFKLSLFKPDFKTICRYIKNNGIFKNLNERQMLKYICEKLVFLSNARLVSGDSGAINWDHIQWDFDKVSAIAQSLVGHIVHRELRTFRRYPNFYFYFDQVKALQVWNYWNHMDVVIPFNGLMPKGEIGINPAHADLKYKVFSCNVYNKNNNFFVIKKEQINVKIVPKLVDLRSSFMRRQRANCLRHID